MPLVTTLFAFVMGMLVVAATGHNPFTAFRGIFNGTGLNWFFPWVLGQERSDARGQSFVVRHVDYSRSVRGRPNGRKTLVSAKPVIAATRSPLSVRTISP